MPAALQNTFTASLGAVLQTNALGNIKKYLTDRPTATPFRYTSVRFTVFGQAYFFENFDSSSSAYLGNTVKHTANRNCDLVGPKFVRYELPGIGNYQTILNGETPDTWTYAEAMHSNLSTRYNDVAAEDVGFNESSCIANDGTAYNDSSKFVRKGLGQPFYCDGVGFAAIEEAEYHIGGQRMDKHDGDMMYMWFELNSAGECAPREMVGLAHSREHNDLELKQNSMCHQVKYAPFCFSFCRAPAMAAPLISTMYNSLSLHIKFRPFSQLICGYSGAGTNAAGTTSAVWINTAVTTTPAVNSIAQGVQLFTRKRRHEDTLANSRQRGQDVCTAEHQLPDATAHVELTTTNLAQADFPVSMVSLCYFLGPGERAAFASSSFYQIVEAVQRLSMTTPVATSLSFRTDQFQNAASQMYVIPKWPGQLAANEHFTMGGAFDYIRQRAWPVISTMEFITNGATQFQKTDESFYRHVQSFQHHSRIPRQNRLMYSLNFGMKANGRGPVQAIGYINLSRTTNSSLNLEFMQNLWTRDGTTDLAVGTTNSALSAETLTVKLLVSNYNVQQYIGGIAGYKYTQVNMQ